jgi:hypothetical protein
MLAICDEILVDENRIAKMASWNGKPLDVMLPAEVLKEASRQPLGAAKLARQGSG